MKVLIDQNLDVEVARWLTARNYDASHTSEVHLDTAPDQSIFEYCRKTQSVLVTFDKKLTKFLASESAGSPTVIILRGYSDPLDALEDIESALQLAFTVMVMDDHAVLSVRHNKPTRIEMLPLGVRVEEIDE